MSSPGVGLALASLTAWGLYGYLFSKEQRSMGRDPRGEDVDRELGETIRLAIAAGRVVTSPRDIHVRATNGYVTLSGIAPRAEAVAVAQLVRALPRVKSVRDRVLTAGEWSAPRA